jgi:hypothetical protein
MPRIKQAVFIHITEGEDGEIQTKLLYVPKLPSMEGRAPGVVERIVTRMMAAAQDPGSGEAIGPVLMVEDSQQRRSQTAARRRRTARAFHAGAAR